MTSLYPQQSTSRKAKFQEASNIYKDLKAEFDSKKRDNKKCMQLITKSKLLLADLSFMPTIADNATEQENMLARGVLEIACLLAVEMKDLQEFERQITELKCYYSMEDHAFQASPYTHQLLGLDLLSLLAQNRLADFHAALEILPTEIVRTSPYVRHPIELEQFLMEGSYNKVFAARENIPSENFKFFIDMLLGTVRTEIASCLEKAYDVLSFNDAGRLLFLQTPQELADIVRKRNWKVNSQTNEIIFKEKGAEGDGHGHLSVGEVGKNLLSYARSLETII